MAFYDQPGIFFDATGLFYDQAVAASATRTKHMAKVKLELKDKTDSELLVLAKAHRTAMTGNANYTTPLPDAAAYSTRVDAYEGALDASEQADAAAEAATAVKNNERALIEQALTQRGAYVDIASGGDEAKILTSAFGVRSQAAPPPPSLPPPANLAATMGDSSGEIDLSWNSIPGAKSYVVQRSDNVLPRNWQQIAILTRSKHTATGLTSGQTYSFRVRVIGSGGDSDWSDEAIKMAP